MKCPHCKKELEFIAPVERNCEAYRGLPKGVTTCCGNIVRLEKVVTFITSIPWNHDELIKDDWGNPKQKK